MSWRYKLGEIAIMINTNFIENNSIYKGYLLNIFFVLIISVGGIKSEIF